METRKITEREYIPDKNANNKYLITCPFCGEKTMAQLRGYYARGRRCIKCKALFTGEIATKKQ